MDAAHHLLLLVAPWGCSASLWGSSRLAWATPLRLVFLAIGILFAKEHRLASCSTISKPPS